jgi:uncharacterized membrane protein
MKNIKKIIITLILLVIPIGVFAQEGISNYYIDATILNNGDLSVKELIVLNGEFNGYERIINFINPNASKFDGSLVSFEGSDIYNASGLKLEAIADIPVSGGFDFASVYYYFLGAGTKFQKTDYANIGDYGVYEETSNDYSKTYKIYNPSNGRLRGFYLEYILEDMAVVHNDTAELGWNLFSTGVLKEYISNFELHLNIPGNQNLRVWAHGPLSGDVSLNGNDQVIVKISYVNAGTAFDVRTTFDLSVVSNSTKTTNVNAIDSILEVEKKLAEDANRIRDILKLQYYGLLFLSFSWFVGLIVLIVYMYNKYDKERNSTFKVKYFRDFPAKYGPEVVGYLFTKSIGNKDLSASIVNLIEKKVITYEEITPKKYTLKYNSKDINLTASEKYLIEWLFIKIGQDGIVTVDEINKNARTNYDSFLTHYNAWKALVISDVKSYNFFEIQTSAKLFASLYSLFGILIAIYNINLYIFQGFSIMIIIVAIIGFMYFVTITKRTEKGNEDYLRWKGLKNFLNDFGRFKDRDLPMIVLWEKYLVYAMVFGIADKLAKTMSIKFSEMNQPKAGMPNSFDVHYINTMILLNRSINSTVNNAVGTATSMSAAAHSRSSSSGGFGGGFSSGGGSFGGGGGGGRF